MDAIEQLVEGFGRFRRNRFEAQADTFRRLVDEGQHPRVLVVGCADSRVDPAILLDAAPGELFMVRNVANLVPPYGPSDAHHGTSAALEYGVRDLQVEEIIVLGHAYCGGIRACLETIRENPPEREFIGTWIDLARPACESAVREAGTCDCGPAAEKASILRSLDNLRTFPWISERVQAGNLRLHGWWFDLDRGVLEASDGDGGFRPLAP